ncbi:sugar phosphate isomerase/epimerase family protein [Nocardiopsis akebiae]|uniref:sugar phosphate isomerase/epimerase family protein n=1 Tax=Nocardiopsis akebiae TaxID=2831968 RepID=UPI0020168F14|nr:sugar phosphate isomerase/epimerase [Nocardiopsis akebiae]
MRALGVNTWVWTSPLTDAALERIAPRVAEWGFDVIELPVENAGDWDPRRARTLLDGLGLTASVVLVMGPGRELVATDAATRSATQDYLRRVVDAAAAVGSPVAAGPAYSSVGRTWRMSPRERAGIGAELTEALAPVVGHCSAAGVRLAVEPLNRYETSVLNTVDQGLEMLADLPAEHCGLALDVYHMNIEERDVAAAVRRAGMGTAPEAASRGGGRATGQEDTAPEAALRGGGRATGQEDTAPEAASRGGGRATGQEDTAPEAASRGGGRATGQEDTAPEAALRGGGRATGGRVAHVQVCANDRGAPGADHLDWSAILDALDDVGYGGPLVIESFTADNASIATAASVWRPLAATQDAIAVDGLAFLRALSRREEPPCR